MVQVVDTKHALGPPLLGALMRLPWEAIQRRVFDELRAGGFADVSRAHMQVMRWPGPQGRRPSEVAAELGMTKQALNYLLGQLEEAGYLKRSTGAGDGRVRTIELTVKGTALALTFRRAVEKVERQLARELGAAEMNRLRDLLVRLNATSLVQDALHEGPTPAASGPALPIAP